MRTQIEDSTLDADDAWVEFTDDIMQAEENELGEMYFKEGFNRGMEAMRTKALTMLENERAGNILSLKGREDMLFDASNKDGTGIISEAIDRWKEWTDAHEMHQINTQPETWVWAREAFVDGYLRGVQKKITGE